MEIEFLSEVPENVRFSKYYKEIKAVKELFTRGGSVAFRNITTRYAINLRGAISNNFRNHSLRSSIARIDEENDLVDLYIWLENNE